MRSTKCGGWPFLLQLFNCEDHVLFTSCSSKATMLLRVNLFSFKVESGKGNMGSDLPHNAEQGDATVVVTVSAVSFVFVPCHVLGIVLGDTFRAPTKEVVKIWRS